MRPTRYAWALLLIAVPVLAAACGGDGDEGTPAAGTPPPKETQVSEPATAEEQLLAGVLLTAQEMGQALPGREWAATSLGMPPPEAAGPAGLVTSWGAGYSTRDGEQITVTLDLYQTPDQADAALLGLLDQFDAEGVDIQEFDAPGVGDQAQGQVNRPSQGVYTFMFMRSGRVVGAISAPLGDKFGERREEVIEIARQLAQKLQTSLEE